MNTGQAPGRNTAHDPGRGVYMISVAADLAGMHPQTLRIYEQRGLIEPQRSAKGTRLYSEVDVQRLQRINELRSELGMSLAGVERVMRLELELSMAEQRVAELERAAGELRQAMREEAERIRKSFRAEIVPYQRGEIVAVRRPPSI